MQDLKLFGKSGTFGIDKELIYECIPILSENLKQCFIEYIDDSDELPF